MRLQTSRKVFKSEIHARLVGRTLGIAYWIINVAYLIKESLTVVQYYFGYLLSQDAGTTTQVQEGDCSQLPGSHSYNHSLGTRCHSVDVYNFQAGKVC